jgi:hypothetical protein
VLRGCTEEGIRDFARDREANVRRILAHGLDELGDGRHGMMVSLMEPLVKAGASA